jgi:Methyltransferase domain
VRVYATEVKDDLLDEIRDRAERAGLGNVQTVRGDQDGTGPPPGCCDAILLRMVYHHFENPERMEASLRREWRKPLTPLAEMWQHRRRSVSMRSLGNTMSVIPDGDPSARRPAIL